jgi:hypothetical protein
MSEIVARAWSVQALVFRAQRELAPPCRAQLRNVMK